MPSLKNQPKIIGVPWSLKSVWNACLENLQDKPLMPRNYMYASELGQSFCDRYLKMYGVPFSNPVNDRAKRKFLAGNLWEWTVGLVLVSAGVFQKRQIAIRTQMKKCLMVSGRLDFIVGGQFNYEPAKAIIDQMKGFFSSSEFDLPPFFFDAADRFVDKYKNQILQDVIYECKSVSDHMMDKVMKSGPMDHHVLQNYHYVAGNELGIQKGMLGYISKNDCLMEEFEINHTPAIKKAYIEDIKQMTEHYNAGFDRKNPMKLMPPKDDEVKFEQGVWKFYPNWKIQYSPYLKMIYGYDSPDHFGRNKWQPKCISWNGAFKRYVLEGQSVPYKVKGETKERIISITDNNKEKRADAIASGFAWDKLVAKAKAAGAFISEDDQESETE